MAKRIFGKKSYKPAKKPCPKCGSEKLKIGNEKDDERVPFEQIRCPDCGFEELTRWLG